MSRIVLLGSRYRPRVGRSGRRPLRGQDPGEHGDRPQRDARPVGLDERSPDPLARAGTGTRRRRRRRGSTPTTTSTTPTRTSAARTATSATRSCGSTRTRSGTRSIWPSRSTTWCSRRSSSGASPSTTSTSRRSDPARSQEAAAAELKGMARKAREQIVKDYIALPALSGLAIGRPASTTRWRPTRRAPRRPSARAVAARRASRAIDATRSPRAGRQPFRSTLKANVTANVVRNVWAYAIIFCGHFPDQTYTFSQEETEDETRGAKYVRQLLGRGEHRGRPVLPRRLRQPRLPGRAPPLPGHAEHPLRGDRAEGEGHLRALRAALQHGPRSTSSSGTVQRTILRLAFPGGEQRPKPGPYRAAEDEEREPVAA